MEQLENGLTIREAKMDDAADCGRIFYASFESIAMRHSFPVEPGSPEFANYKAGELIETDGIVGFVAERDGRILGSAFVDERSPIAGIGPVTIDPAAQDAGVGRALMEHVLRHETIGGAPGVRLVQTAYHTRSFALYAKLGFVVREPLSVVQRSAAVVTVPGLDVRPAERSDLAACNAVCVAVHGHERAAEVAAAIAQSTAHVVVRDGRIVGYATGFGYGWHAVATDNAALIALLGSAPAFLGLGILVPSRNAALLGWCLEHGCRVVQPATLMTIGLYNEPAGAWLPSIVY